MDYFYSENFSDIFFYGSLIFTLPFFFATSFFSPPYIKMSENFRTRFYTRLFYKFAILVSINCIILGVWLIADWPSRLGVLNDRLNTLPADYFKNPRAAIAIVIAYAFTILGPIFLLFLGYERGRAFYLVHSLINKLETFKQTNIELLEGLDKEEKSLTSDPRKRMLVVIAIFFTLYLFLILIDN
jgi:hypothetical protein